MSPLSSSNLAEITEPFQPNMPTTPRLRSVNVGEFIDMELPPRKMALSPIIPIQGLVMAYAPRGIGKTYFALSTALAVASGGSALRYTAPEPRRVLYVDGEMPANVMQERLSFIAAGMTGDISEPDNLRLITPDLQPDVWAEIGTEAGRKALDEHTQGIDLLVLDNLSTLCRGIEENKGDAWTPVQDWILTLRKRGMSVLMIHHAGKGGAQRGTSRREDVLDTVINLKRPADYTPEDGARFEVHLEKARGIHGDDTKPYEAKLDVRDGVAVWTTQDLADLDYERVIQLSKEGMKVREIAEDLGFSKSKVNRLQKRAKAEGVLA